MAKKRRGRRKTSLITKGINALALFIGFSPAISEIMSGGDVGTKLVNLYSAGMATRGVFVKDLAIRAYGPILAAILFKKGVSMLRKTARI